jgi:phytoene synthase
VREDVERGRIYLSSDLFRDSGVDPLRMLELSEGAPIRAEDLALLRGVELHAQTLYRSAGQLVPMLSPDARPAMRVLVRIYHRLLDRIAADPSAIFRKRVSVPTAEKLLILAGGLAGSLKARLLG